MNLRRLELFLAVAQRRSFSRSAEALYISQPAISSQIRRLEQELGVRLFYQSGRETLLTEAGEALCNYAERLLALHDEAVRTMAEYRDMKRGHFRISATTTPGTYLLPILLSEFRKDYPQLEITLVVDNYTNVIARLLSSQVDFALVAGPVDGQDELSATPVCTDKLVLISAPGLMRPPIEAIELMHNCMILREQGSGTRSLVEKSLRRAGIKLQSVLELPSTESIKQAVMAGLGWSIVSELTVRREVERGDLLAHEPSFLNIERPILLTYRKNKYFSPLLSRFISYIASSSAESSRTGTIPTSYS